MVCCRRKAKMSVNKSTRFSKQLVWHNFMYLSVARQNPVIELNFNNLFACSTRVGKCIQPCVPACILADSADFIAPLM